MIQFLENKYKKWYENIVNSAKIRNTIGYAEIHHIIPKSLGGSNSIDNLVTLTAREHFICHLLLTKFTTGNAKRLMSFALGKFIQNSPLQQREFNSWEYKKIRENISKARTGKKHSEETKRKMSQNKKGQIPWNKGKIVSPCTEERKMVLSNYWKGKPKSDEHKLKIKKSKIGHNAGMTGKQHSEETKQKMSESMKGSKGPQKRFDICPTCKEQSVTARHVKFCKNKKVKYI